MSALSAMTSLVVLAQMGAGQAPAGRLGDTWGYVWSSYGITWGALCLYALSLWLRRPKNLPTGSKE